MTRAERVGTLACYSEVCVESANFVDADGRTIRLKRGQRYSVSRPHNGTLTVFMEPWIRVPARLFKKKMFAPTRVLVAVDLKRRADPAWRMESAA